MMIRYENIIYSLDGNIATITLNRPGSLNAFTRALRKELLAAVNQANNDPKVRVVILAGAGRAFCAGADLLEHSETEWLVEAELLEEYKPILMAIHNSPKLYITAVQGAAAGAGSAFAIISDLCVMAENAYLYQAFAALGFVPDCGASWFLTQQLGQKRALEFMLSGEKVTAQRCLELGLVNRVVPIEVLMEETQKLARMIAEKAPLSVEYSKKLVKTMPHTDLESAIALEAKYQKICVASEDNSEGIAAFLEKREPKFLGK